MAQTNVNIRMDAEIKQEAEQLFEKLGMNMSTAFNIFIRQTLRTGGIPFKVKIQDDGFNNHFNQQQLIAAAKQIKAGKGTIHDLLEDRDE